MYFAETEEANYEIVDGHQRIKTIVRYLTNHFRLKALAVLSEYNGLRFHQLPEREQRFLRMRSIRAIIISADSHPNMKFEVFERLNTGSIALNAQELRNSFYRGPFNRQLKELALDASFRRCVGTTKPRKRMVDQELVLRFLALYNEYPRYRPPLKRFLNEYMAQVRNADEQYLSMCEQTFRSTTRKVEAAFGKGAFRITNRRGQPIEAPVVRALYDAQMLVMAHTSLVEVELRHLHAPIWGAMADLYEDGDFLELLRRATGDRSRLFMRVERVRDALTQAGVTIELPHTWA